MAETRPTSVEKATLTPESGDAVTCWFNPKEYSISKSNTWGPPSHQAASDQFPTPQFTGSQPRELSLDLFFDDSEDDTGDIRPVIGALFAMMEVTADKGAGRNKARPPYVTFAWGATYTFKAAMKSLSVQYTMFRSDGVPIRATARVAMTQVEPAPTESGRMTRQNPTTTGLAGLRSHVMRDGDSLQSIAWEYYGDPTEWRVLAEANGIDDPLSVPRGTLVSIPVIGA
jgi:hypothetical protein